MQPPLFSRRLPPSHTLWEIPISALTSTEEEVSTAEDKGPCNVSMCKWRVPIHHPASFTLAHPPKADTSAAVFHPGCNGKAAGARVAALRRCAPPKQRCGFSSARAHARQREGTALRNCFIYVRSAISVSYTHQTQPTKA